MQRIAMHWVGVHLRIKNSMKYMIRSVYDIILKNYKLIANSCRVPTVAKNFKLSIGSIFISIKFDTKPIIRCLKDNPSSI